MKNRESQIKYINDKKYVSNSSLDKLSTVIWLHLLVGYFSSLVMLKFFKNLQLKLTKWALQWAEGMSKARKIHWQGTQV